MWKHLLLCVLAVMMPWVIACGKAEEKAAEKMIEKAIEKQGGGKADVDLSGQRFSAKTDEGEVEISTKGDVKIPSDFPKDVHVYKGAKVLMAGKQAEGMMLTLETGDGMEKVSEIYADRMVEAGWTEESSMNMGRAALLVFAKGDKMATVTVTGVGSKCQIMLVVGGK